MKLKLKQVERHQAFLKNLAAAAAAAQANNSSQKSRVKRLRAQIKKANFVQLRTLIKVLAAVALRQVPASQETAEAFAKSRKKVALKTYFGTWKKTKALLNTKQPDRWRNVLLDLAALVGLAAGELVHQEEEKDAQQGAGPGEGGAG